MFDTLSSHEVTDETIPPYLYVCPAYQQSQDPSHFRCIQRFYCRKQAVSLRYPNNIRIYAINLRKVERIRVQSSPSEGFIAKQF